MMRSRLLSIALFAAFCTPLPAQYALRDAVALAPYFTYDLEGDYALSNTSMPASDSMTKTIWRWYFDPTLRPNAENPFALINSAPQNLSTFDRLALSTSRFGLESNTRLPGSVAPANPFSAGVFAQGLAIFLEKRAKEELAAAFFREFSEKIQHDTIAQRLFPATVNLLTLLGDPDDLVLERYIVTLRENFLQDLHNLPLSLEQTVQEKWLVQNPYLRLVATDGLHIARILLEGESPVAVFDYLSSPLAAFQDSSLQRALPEKERKIFQQAAAALQLTQLLSESLRKDEDEWYSPKEVMAFFQNPVVMRLYFGMLWEKARDLRFDKDRSVRNLLEKAKLDGLMQQIQRELLGFVEQTAQSNLVRRSPISGIENDSTRAERFFRYYNAALRALKTGYRCYRITWDDPDGEAAIDRIFLVADGVSRLHLHLNLKNYPAAISDVTRTLDRLEVPDEWLRVFLRHANFVVTVAQARNPEEIADAIEAFALPPGSARVKKTENQVAFAVNAYMGLGFGAEWLETSAAFKPFAALSAPLGLSLTYGTKKGGYIGAFVPIIDVGALTALRLQDQQSYDLPSLKWSNLVSPGLYFVSGFRRKWPMALGLGGQLGPNLRQLNATGGPTPTAVYSGGIRFGAFLSVDIPVLYLFLKN